MDQIIEEVRCVFWFLSNFFKKYCIQYELWTLSYDV